MHVTETKKQIQLLPPDLESEKPIMAAFKNRRSTRFFSEKEISLQTISDIAWIACGMNREDEKRTVPLLWDNLLLYFAMESGVYSFDPRKNILNLIINEDIRSNIPDQNFAKKAPVILLLGLDDSDLNQMTEQVLGEGGGVTLYSGMQIAYTSQSIYLYAAASNLNTIALGWFDQAYLKEKLQLSEKTRFFLAHPVGYHYDSAKIIRGQVHDTDRINAAVQPPVL